MVFKLKIKILLIFTLFLLCFSTTSITFASEEITIEKESVNARSGPGTDYEIVDKLKSGESYIVEERQDDWIKIKLKNKKKAWVANWLVSEKDTNSSKFEEYQGIVTTKNLKVRSGPSTSNEILDRLAKGQSVMIIDKENEWFKITYKGGKGWAHSSYISTENPKKKESEYLKPPYAKITAPSLIARENPSLTSKKVMTVKKDETYKILKEEGYYYQIKVSEKEKGWIPRWFTSSVLNENSNNSKEKTVTILYDHTPLRESKSVHSKIVKTAKKGDTYTVTAVNKNNYEIKLGWGKKAYVTGWLVEADENTPQIKKQGAHHTFENKTIVLDPGHGGNDSGTIGTNGNLEKELTLYTARTLQKKLEASGANVIITREDDRYFSLSSRVRLSNIHRADAFISLHYDAAEQKNIRGITPYYYHKSQQSLANAINKSLEAQGHLKIRPARSGDYHVLRHNSQPAVLIELGYLSNPEEEMIVTSNDYQHAVTTAIYDGLGNYFKSGQ